MPHTRRTSPRLPVRFSVMMDDGEHFDIVTAVNLSTGGLYIRTNEPLPPGTEVFLTPVGNAGEVLETLRARVVWCADDKTGRRGMGIQFVDVPADMESSVGSVVREYAN